MNLLLKYSKYYFKSRLIEALKAKEQLEVPVGCVIVFKNKIIGRGYNQTNKLKNATFHAEMVAIDGILKTYPKEIFKECSLFVTIEPCLMCSR